MTGTPVSRPTGRCSLSDPLQTLTDEHIVAQIPPGSRVLDLGCGDGRLLEGGGGGWGGGGGGGQAGVTCGRGMRQPGTRARAVTPGL
jgi:hypothetical protein